MLPVQSVKKPKYNNEIAGERNSPLHETMVYS